MQRSSCMYIGGVGVGGGGGGGGGIVDFPSGKYNLKVACFDFILISRCHVLLAHLVLQ